MGRDRLLPLAQLCFSSKPRSPLAGTQGEAGRKLLGLPGALPQEELGPTEQRARLHGGSLLPEAGQDPSFLEKAPAPARTAQTSASQLPQGRQSLKKFTPAILLPGRAGVFRTYSRQRLRSIKSQLSRLAPAAATAECSRTGNVTHPELL